MNKLPKIEIASLTINMNRYEGLQQLIETFNCKVGVEVGVREGRLSNFLIFKTNLEKLYGIDLIKWKGPCYLETINPNYIFRQGDSLVEVNKFEDNSVDFVHLDSDHIYEHVKPELSLWWPKIKVGGILSGDDFMECTDKVEGPFGVQKAVLEFVQEKNLQLYIIGLPTLDLNVMNEHGIKMGQQRELLFDEKPSTFIEPPNYFIIKE